MNQLLKKLQEIADRQKKAIEIVDKSIKRMNESNKRSAKLIKKYQNENKI